MLNEYQKKEGYIHVIERTTKQKTEKMEEIKNGKKICRQITEN